MKKIIYVLTIEYDPDSDSIETMKEEIIEDIQELSFKGNIEVLNSMDDESISMITDYEIGEC
tara:strand:+ start:250 stop:435 length:186 start_codon:yes stop_codon:yes gene_type:complete